jgi:hypothetical protein
LRKYIFDLDIYIYIGDEIINQELQNGRV